MKFYKCAKCGAVVAKIVEKPCPIMCCGEEMVELTANTEEAAFEKHIPDVTMDVTFTGTIDLICQNDDGEFTIYDWKRSSKVVNAQGQPIVEGFRGKMSHNGINLPDTSFYHYCIQQNLYRFV